LPRVESWPEAEDATLSVDGESLGDAPLVDVSQERKPGSVGEEGGGTGAEEFEAVREDVCEARFPANQAVGDAVDLLDVRGNGHLRIDELFESG
jgi:hypothetical protein